VEGEDVGDVYPHVHVRPLQAWGVEMVGHILLARKLSFSANPAARSCRGGFPKL
jgi:hypothetical protein